MENRKPAKVADLAETRKTLAIPTVLAIMTAKRNGAEVLEARAGCIAVASEEGRLLEVTAKVVNVDARAEQAIKLIGKRVKKI